MTSDEMVLKPADRAECDRPEELALRRMLEQGLGRHGRAFPELAIASRRLVVTRAPGFTFATFLPLPAGGYRTWPVAVVIDEACRRAHVALGWNVRQNYAAGLAPPVVDGEHRFSESRALRCRRWAVVLAWLATLTPAGAP